ncbi:hypothetical protein cyc_02137 [Cyclospora cayetanensis]|uniref:Uncharacterized protein n=1 Tax=Cyclospora cayetanensis TaxID=88456 RepID=A0A1D3CTT8_9EIME|nr:hypothetical protein cyc_02137 [Cyclospora cayetanensis]
MPLASCCSSCNSSVSAPRERHLPQKPWRLGPLSEAKPLLPLRTGEAGVCDWLEAPIFVSATRREGRQDSAGRQVQTRVVSYGWSRRAAYLFLTTAFTPDGRGPPEGPVRACQVQCTDTRQEAKCRFGSTVSFEGQGKDLVARLLCQHTGGLGQHRGAPVEMPSY